MGSYCSTLTMLGACLTFLALAGNYLILLPCEGRLLQNSEERSDYYYDDINDQHYYDENDEYYSYDDIDNNDDLEDEVDYASIHEKVPFHKSQISYREAIYLPSLYKPAGKEDKPTLQRNRLRDIFVAIRCQCGGGQRDLQQGLCQYF